MSLVQLSPSPPSAASSAKAPFKNSIWRPVVALGGALGVGLLTAPLLMRPVASTTTASTSPTADLPEIVMQRENTLIVQPSMPPGVLLRGQIRLVADMTGKAPVSGAVARQVVEPGTHVKKGDPVLEISSGAAERPAPAVEAVQNQAEQSQIAAADAQMALSQKMNLAQTRLRAAQERVDRAQSQVGTARDLVRRLQNGEAVALAEIPAPFRDASDSPRPNRKRRRAWKIAVERPAVDSAQTTRQALRDNARALQAARQALTDAQKAARVADDNMKAAAQNVATVEARFDQKKASGADVELARGAQKDAEDAVNAADRAMIRAKLHINELEDDAAALKKTGSIGADVAPTPTSSGDSSANNAADAASQKVTLDQAIKFAGAALDESRRASRDAEKIHSEIDDYQRQVSASKTRIESATKALTVAQQEVLDAVPRPHFTSAVAPADGIVTWVSRLAREVGVGDSVFGLARGTKVAAQFEDKEGLWRGLKPGATLSAIAVTSPTLHPTATAGQPQTALASTGAVDNPTVAVKITEIDAPETDSEPATVSAEVQPSVALPAGTEILAAVARPGQRPTLSVPNTALVRRGDTTYLAVLAPPTGGAAEKENKAGADSVFLLRWQPVKTGRGDGIRQEIVAGLTPGTRVVSLLGQLDELGLTPSNPDSPMANSTPDSVSQDAKPEQIAVRLTGASA